ncbi:MAG: NADP-dependent malic enzyme [Pseudomonadota bacterium]|nr:NADP-dependent malic enzyme [Pseudomonadota bacterium]
MTDDLVKDALDYHRRPPAGKLEIAATKPMANQRDLALAYSPGVAEACKVIADDPAEAATVTARGNLVAVVSNGTAVLGLGDIGPLASKPVMEGKAVLFKKFAGIDVFDIEVDAVDVERFVTVTAALEPTFGGINLEDIKAPECFEIEAKLRDCMNIPVFHDDQHGTAIIVASAIYNGLHIVGKNLKEIKIVTSGAGAAAIACLDLLVDMGVPLENIFATDRDGVIHDGRKDAMHVKQGRYAQNTGMRTLAEVIKDADVFLGLSAPNVLKPELLQTMADKPLILALANPVPEIMPDLAQEARPDAIVATGRSDFPNQVNNVLCFPFIFRGALDVGATTINEEMKIATVKAIANLARVESSDVVAQAYGDENLKFGPGYIIPKPFDPRLISEIAPAVAKAAMTSGVATRPITDMDAYIQQLDEFVWRSGNVMKPVIDRAISDPKRVVYAEGEERRVLHAAQVVIDEGMASPILIGRRSVVVSRIEELGLRMRPDDHFELVDPENDSRYHKYWTEYHNLQARRGVSPEMARTVIRTSTTAIAAMMLKLDEADAMLCGTYGQFQRHLMLVRQIIGRRDGVKDMSTMIAMILPRGVVFIADTHITHDPDVEELVETATLCVEAVRRFGVEPKVAFVSHSNFGTTDWPSARKMRRAVRLLQRQNLNFEVEGEMHSDAAIDKRMRERGFPNNLLEGSANLLIMPSLDAAHISYNLLKALGEGLPVGPVLVGAAQPAHVMTTSVTARGLVNMTALAVSEAQAVD